MPARQLQAAAPPISSCTPLLAPSKSIIGLPFSAFKTQLDGCASQTCVIMPRSVTNRVLPPHLLTEKLHYNPFLRTGIRF